MPIDIASLVTLALTLVVVLLAVVVVRTKKSNQVFRSFPALPGHALLGNLMQMDGTLLFDYIRRCMQSFPKLHVNYIGVIPQVSLTHPDTNQVILREATPKAFNYRFFRPWLGDSNMFVNHGQVWHQTRRILTPMFSRELLREYLSAYTAATHSLISKWQGKSEQTVALGHDFALLALDITLQAGFGYQSECQTKAHPLPGHFGAMNELVWRRTINPLLHSDFVFNLSSAGRASKNHMREIKRICGELVTKRRQLLATGEPIANTPDGKPVDFLQLLIDAAPDGVPVPDEEVLSSVIGLIFASYDTSCTSLSWIFYTLAKYPEWQARCRDEVLHVLGRDDAPTYDQLAELTTVQMVVKEVLRMHPPVPMIGRTTEKPMDFDGHTVPANTWVEIAIWGTHHNPSVWTDPEVFDPTRFAPEKVTVPYAFLPFSAGPRNCLGQNFAINELKTVVAMMLQRFEIRPDPLMEEPKLVAEIMLLTRPGLSVVVAPLAAGAGAH